MKPHRQGQDAQIVPVERAICNLFSASEAVVTGRIIAVIGAKGGGAKWVPVRVKKTRQNKS